MQIKINKQSLKEDTTILIDVIRKIVKDNKHNAKQIQDSILLEIVKCISSWKESYVNDRIIDGATYTIKIKSNNGMKTYIFKNKYPENFSDFLKALQEVISD